MADSADQRPIARTRRSVLAGAATGVAALSGCTKRLRTVMGRNGPERVSVTIRTAPADEDPYAQLIARQLASWFDAAGVGARVVPMGREALLRRVLVNHEFDVFVGRYPDQDVEPDGFWGLLHSRYATEPGWQNPFGFTDLAVDDLLERQRRETGDERREAVAELQRTVLARNPLTVLGFPDDIRAARTDRFEGFGGDPTSPLTLLSLERADADATTLRATTTDTRPTANLNPLVAALRRRGIVTDLVYDALGHRQWGRVVPWLASSWDWVGSDPNVLDVELREDLTWHDGESLTPADVAFTYDFLADTSMGERRQAVPTMRYRGHASPVEAVTVRDERTVRVQFGQTNRRVAERALTVPLLPRHVWAERTGEPTVGGVDLGGRGTEALVTRNVPPVGSGPLSFVEASAKSRLVLERFDDHFLRRSGAPDVAGVGGGPAFEKLVVQYAGADQAAVELVESGDADLTLSAVGPDVVRRIGRADDLNLLVQSSEAFYFAGYNARRAPFANPRFRQLLARLVDRAALARDVFSEFATPAVTPLGGTGWVPEDLAWQGEAPTAPFLGSDGEVDVEAAREAFNEAGYRYDGDGRLLVT